MDEVRLALRRLVARPGATIASALTLACGIGAAAATWSLLSATLLRPLPVRDPGTLVIASSLHPRATFGGTQRTTFTYPYYSHFRDSGAFEEVAAAWTPALVLLSMEAGGPPVGVQTAFVSHNYFDLLGVAIPHGRGFVPDDDRRGAALVAIVSERYWRTALRANPSAVGSTLDLAGKRVSIVGIAPPRFRGLSLAEAPALYLPLHTIADVGPAATNYFADPNHQSSPTEGTMIIGRLSAGVSRVQVTARLTALPSPPGVGGTQTLALLDINTAAIPVAAREGTAQFARLLGWTVALLLMIGIATVGMLLLVRTEARKEEFATCLALGASRGRLARGIMIEGALLATAGAALSPVVAYWLFAAIGTFQLPGGIDLGMLELTLDGRAVAVTARSAVLATLLIGLTAGVFGFRADVSDSLRARAGSTPRIARRGTRAALLSAQVAVALVLVAGTGLFARSLLAALSLNERIDSHRILSGSVAPGSSPARASAFFDDLRGRLTSNPSVEGFATAVTGGGMGPGGRLRIDGVPREFPYFIEFRWVDDDYFRTLRTRVLRGRDFSRDDSRGASRVAIVSESFGRMIGAGGDPLRRRISLMFGGKLDVEIVGVVDDVFNNIRDNEPLALYMPIAQSQAPVVSRTVVLRAAEDPDAVRREMMSAVREIDPAITPGPLRTIDEALLRQMAPQQFGMLVLGSLGTIALLLTVLGTYVLAETMAVMRTREMGIRAALGATGSQLGAIVLRETASLVGIGLSAGVLLAWLGAGMIRSFLFRVQPLDTVTLFAVGAGIFVLALVVSLRPALRAARVDLASVLRAE